MKRNILGDDIAENWTILQSNVRMGMPVYIKVKITNNKTNTKKEKRFSFDSSNNRH